MIAEDLKYHTQHFLSDNREILFISHSSKNSHHSGIKKRTIEQCRKIVKFLDENQIHYAVVPNNFAYLFYFDGDDVKEFGFTVNRHKMSVEDFIEYLMIEMKTLKKNGITFWKIDVVNDNIWFKLHPEKAISYHNLSDENGSIARQKYDPDNFDEKYYKDMSITDSFSLLRPLTRGFTESHRFLTSNCSVTVFGFEFWKRLDELRKKFKPVYGYDINELAIREADKNGYEGFVELQDVIEDFEPAFPKTDISICFYLLEHLADSQCRKVLDNMIKTSPVNFVVVTSNEEYNFYLDPTHMNSKTFSEWNTVFVDFYNSKGWKKLSYKRGKFLFGTADFANNLNRLKERIHGQIETEMATIFKHAHHVQGK